MKYYVDFGGYCEVEAKDEKTAEENFWQLVGDDKPLPCKIYEVQGIEEKREGE